MKTTTSCTPSTCKVRREELGSKRAPGWEWQKDGAQVRRAPVRGLRVGEPDATLSSVGGLVSFNAFVQREGIGGALRRDFGGLKKGRQVVYPMHTQMQLLIDASVVGAKRVFDFESLAADPLFVHLAGGAMPSIDVLYDDLRRFTPSALTKLEERVAAQGLKPVQDTRFKTLTVDIDTTVTPLFGEQEGALPGPNPHYHGRPSYHPIIARIAETDTVLGALLRPGNTGLGENEAKTIKRWIMRLHEASPRSSVTVRVDAGGDCAALLSAIHDAGAHFVVKAKQTANLLAAVLAATQWKTVDRDAFEKPTRQIAHLEFKRADWPAGFRVFAVRTTERDSGKQVCLWNDLDHSVSIYITNDWVRDSDDLARLYDDRAAIEPLIAELKNAFGIGKVSTADFAANHAAFLIKLLAYNLMRRWALQLAAGTIVSRWRAAWIRRACVLVPARLLRSGGRWQIRLAPRPLLN